MPPEPPEGFDTLHLPDGEETTIFDASMKYQEEGVPLGVLAGKEYGSGSSRDWAAKGPRLLGVRFVVAESYERIHRSNLFGLHLELEPHPEGGLAGRFFVKQNHQGPPGHAHGGIVGAALDEAMSLVLH